MHAVEIINYRNAKQCGISVEQNRREALKGQYIRQPGKDIHKKTSDANVVKLTVDSSLLSQQQESPQ